MSGLEQAGASRADPPDEREPILDPVDRISEVMFGLLMTLSFTGALSVASAGREDIRTMLFAALGCNLAWGLVDGLMYLVRAHVSRARGAAIVRAVQTDPDPARATVLIARALPAVVARAMTEAELERLRVRIRAMPPPPAHPPFVQRDVAAAVAIFALVVASTFPVVVPFLLVPETTRAMRWSNAVAIAMLFAAGTALGRYGSLGTVRTGIAMVVLGLVMVGGIVLFGG